ncbi:hypothetical protein HMPREF9123_2167 [Neisseria bacilliformis ATCC BAA-1200]|uniref:Uncharacterized protein n=1 Tax=Neisseria bacilliformis ATCC BAA-1200 TaxID=888742 RepID=F2BEL1_9NEIS|nr:hypothetical protein HMPREF9123_2167 [Neisseria bacilliformis ATCC BAA-1200]
MPSTNISVCPLGEKSAHFSAKRAWGGLYCKGRLKARFCKSRRTRFLPFGGRLKFSNAVLDTVSDN